MTLQDLIISDDAALPLGRNYEDREGNCCCDWGAYVTGILAIAQDERLPEILIDWYKTEEGWKLHCCTCSEGFLFATKDERKTMEAAYIAELQRNNYKIKRS